MTTKHFTKVLLISVFFLLGMQNSLFAQKKKNKGNGEKVNIVKRAYYDITTRNNFYFNSNEIYKEVLRTHGETRKVDYKQFYPIFFHDQNQDFSAYSGQLDEVIKKTGIVLQLHDNGRWKDNTYVLLGKAHFMKGEYAQALTIFQYVATTMKGNIGREAPEITQKEKMKILKEKEKEAKKKIADKKKQIQDAAKAKEKELEEKNDAAKDKLETSQKNKQKILEEKIALKKKIIELKSKGKDVTKLEEKLKSLGQESVQEKKKEEEAKKEKEEVQALEDGDTIIDYAKDFNYQFSLKKKEEKLEELDRNSDKPIDELLTDKEKAKLEKEYDERSFWEKIKHQGSRPEALVWMSKCLVELGQYADAKSILTYSKSLRKLSKSQRKEIYLGEAWYHIRRENYATAIDDIEVALKLEKDKKKKSELNYLLGQLQEAINNPQEAISTYQLALKKPKDFDLEFYTQMNIARLAASTNPESQDEVKKMLSKLIKGGKNKEYADQVYYAMAKIEENRGDMNMAKIDLEKSIQKSINNNEQKALSWQMLGELNLEENNIPQAKIAYDSTVAYLSADNKNYNELKELQQIVTELNLHYTTIFEQDSMVRLGKMSKVELENFLAELEIKQNALEKQEKRKNRNTGGTSDAAALLDNNTLTSSNGLWYFYNPELKSVGYNDFKNIWGDIANSDNWRRSQKKNSINEEEITVETIQNTNNNKVSNINNKPILTIPSTPEDFEIAHQKIQTAYYNLGVIYKNKLSNNVKAKYNFETLIRLYPANKYEGQSLYYLYLIYLDEGNLAKANELKSIILSKFPDSEYAKNILNPVQYEVTNKIASSEEDILYASIYDLFNADKFSQYIERKKQIEGKLTSIPVRSKADFMEALSYGKINNIPELKTKLNEVVQKYPGTEVQQKAFEYLNTIARMEGNPVPVAPKETTPQQPDQNLIIEDKSMNGFVYDESQSQFIFILVRDKSINLSGIKDKISAFNDNSYNELKLRTNITFLQDNLPAYLIKKFDDISAAKKYVEKLQNKLPQLAGENESKQLDIVIISQENYKTLFNNKDFDGYKVFYQKNYK